MPSAIITVKRLLKYRKSPIVIGIENGYSAVKVNPKKGGENEIV